jgi:hypothetical protein
MVLGEGLLEVTLINDEETADGAQEIVLQPTL